MLQLDIPGDIADLTAEYRQLMGECPDRCGALIDTDGRCPICDLLSQVERDEEAE